jgi:hypothetical protein
LPTRDPRIEPRDNRIVRPRLVQREEVRRVQRFDRQRKRDVETAPGIKTVEVRSGDAHNRHGPAVDHQRPAQDLRVPAKRPRPVAIADHGRQACRSSIVF